MKKLNSQNGFTIVEALVAAGLLGGLALGGMTMFRNQTRGQKTVEANYDITNITQNMRVILAVEDNCTASFTGLNPNGADAMEIKKSINGVMTAVYGPRILIPGSNVKVDALRIEKNPAASLAANETWLKVTFNKGRSTYTENTQKLLKIVYTTSGSTIASCYVEGGNGSDSFWMQDTPPDIYFMAGRVGIGTTTPPGKLGIVNQDTAANTPAALSISLPGIASGTPDPQYGIKIDATGYNNSTFLYGVHATATPATTAPAYALYGKAAGTTGDVFGLYATANQNDLSGPATAYGVFGLATSTPGAGTTGKSYGGYFNNTADAGGAAVGVYTASKNGSPLVVSSGAASTTRMIVTNNGSVGIGTPTPTNTLTINGETSIINGQIGFNRNPLDGSLPAGGNSSQGRGQITLSPASNFAMEVFSNSGVATGGLYIRTSDGYVGIGTISPGALLDVAGDVRATNYVYSSDKRLKDNILPLKDALSRIEKLSGVSFTWKENGDRSIGFIAQDVKKVEPLLVTELSDGFLGVRYGNIVALVVEAIKELAGDQDEIRNELALLKKENEDLRKRLEALEKR